ncbi:MAG: M56 family metallopeptidase, partial [Caldisericaceae bacterium]
MNKKTLIAGVVLILVALIVGLVVLVPKMFDQVTGVEKTEITSLVEDFGKTLSKVDKVAPSDIVSQNIKELYSPFLTDNLILQWTFDPSKALGRVCSSPWPDRIQILSMEKLDAYTVKVKGYVVWAASGGNGNLEVTEKVPVVVILRKDSSTQKFKIY